MGEEQGNPAKPEAELVEAVSPGFKLTELGPLPEEWQVASFGHCVLHQRPVVGRVKRSEYRPVGRFPVVDQGQASIAGYWDEEEDVYKGPLPVIIFGDHTRVFKYVDSPFVCGADGTRILLPNTSRYDARFLFFACLALDLPSRGYNRHF